MSTLADLRRVQSEVGELVAKHEQSKSLVDLSTYHDNPVGFLRDVLHFEPWAKQVEMAEMIRDNAHAAIVSANSIGKDALMSRLALWWVYARRGFVLMTSVTDRQARHVSMKELRKAFLRAPGLPGDLFQMELRVDDHSGVLAFTSDNVEKLVGFHHPRLLVLMSEAQGLDAEVFEAANACATGPASKIVAYGNPTVVAGTFYDRATKGQWASLSVSALEHPNLVSGRDEIPGGPSRAWVDSMAAEYGTTSSIYRSRVLSQWPDESVEGLLKRPWVEAAFTRHESGELHDAAMRYRPPNAVDHTAPPSAKEIARRGYSPLLSVDVARFGADSSVIAVCRGPVVEALHTWHHASIVESANRVIAHAERLWTNRSVARPRIVVDDAGVGGGLTDVLRARGWSVAPFNGATKARDPKKHLNARAEAYWAFREQLERGTVAIPRDADLLEEALATEWQVHPSGAVQILSKDDIRKTLRRSPDKLDAVVMGLATTMGATGHRAWVGTYRV